MREGSTLKFKSTGLSLFLAFLVNNIILISFCAIIVDNNIAPFSDLFFLLLGCPFPIFLTLCIINMKVYVRKYDVTEREKKFYKICTRVMKVLIILSVLNTIICAIP